MKPASLVIAVGVGLVVIGLLWRFFPALFSWFGHLPGDITHKSGDTTVFIPITSMIVVSVVATLILNLLGRLFRGP